MVNDEIKSKWRKKKIHKLPKIKTETLNCCVSVIKSQSVFNVHNNVLNKTQPRAISDWSFCSTVTYCIVILCSHYLPDVDPNPYHPKKKLYLKKH